jgi:hypothetical protein
MNTKTVSIEFLKKQYIDYFEDVPIQRYAAMAIARDEDTIIRWRKEDADFADAVQMAKANWIRKKVLATKAEFALERLDKEVFGRDLNTSYADSPTVALVSFVGADEPDGLA